MAGPPADLVDADLAIGLARDLIRVNTVNPPGNELTLADLLQGRLRDLGIAAEPCLAAEGRASLVARIPGSGGRGGLILSGHLDTVPFGSDPWSRDPLGADLVNGRIYGRGACDMKGAVAAIVAAADAVRRSAIRLAGDLILAFTCGEEGEALGATDLVRRGVLTGAGGLLIGEPTNLDLVIAEKGAFWPRLTFKGKSAHGSMPHLGANAVSAMADFVVRVEAMDLSRPGHPLTGPSTLNVGPVQGGIRPNMVPDRCSVVLDFRTAPGTDTPGLRRRIEDLAREVCGRRPGITFELDVTTDRPPIETPGDHPLVALVIQLLEAQRGAPVVPKGVPYYTDGATLAPGYGLPLVICGPGDPGLAHQVDEWIPAAQVVGAARLYAAIAARSLA